MTKNRCGLNRPVCKCGKEAAWLFCGLSPYYTTTTLLFYIPARLLLLGSAVQISIPIGCPRNSSSQESKPLFANVKLCNATCLQLLSRLTTESISASRLHAHCNLTFPTSFSCSFVSSRLAETELGNSTGRVDLSIIDSTVQLRNISQSS